MMYASDTSVSVSRSSGEIQDMVSRAGGTKFATMTEPERATIAFALNDRSIMFELALPKKEQFETRLSRGKRVPNTADRVQKLYEQACRSHWRALCLTIKAKLVSVNTGVETFEEAFLAQVVVRDGSKSRRFGEIAIRAIADAYSTGKMPPLLGSGS